MRLFVAVDLDENLREAARRVIGDLSARLAAAGIARAVRWVAPENLHLTIQFIGEVDDAQGRRIQDALASPISVAPFDLGLKGAGVFPPSGPPRVVWLGVAEGWDGLERVYGEVVPRLRPLKVEPDARPFAPHLTLGRVKIADQRVTTTLRAAVPAVEVSARGCRVSTVTLYRGHLSPKGPTYEALLRTSLIGVG